MDFFTEYGGWNFDLFGITHILCIIFIIISVFLIFKFKDKLIKFGNFRKIQISMAVIMFLNFVIYYGSKIMLGTYDYKIDLPLHFCFVTGFIFMYILLTNNKNNLYRIIYFCTFVGPIPAIILPDITQCFNRYIFWQFFISHHIMLLFSVYSLVVFKYKVLKKDIFLTYIVGHIFIIMITIFNNIFGTNYVMLTNLPEHIYELLPFTKYLYPIIWLEIASIVALAISYIPAYLVNKKQDELAIE